MHEDTEKVIGSGLIASDVTTPLDLLAYLPFSRTTDHQKGEKIYDPSHPSRSIYLVIRGKVEISQVAENGQNLPLEILRADELFGEPFFLNLPQLYERATVLESTKLMSWTVSNIEGLIMKRPQLGIALLQALTYRKVELARRIESFSLDNIERRVARSVIHFAERLGTREDNGSVRMMPFTHELLSRYIGTKRELVTRCMNRFRQQGYVSYSRHGILVYCDALRAAICDHRVPTAVKSNQDTPSASKHPASATSAT